MEMAPLTPGPWEWEANQRTSRNEQAARLTNLTLALTRSLSLTLALTRNLSLRLRLRLRLSLALALSPACARSLRAHTPPSSATQEYPG